MSDDSWHWAQSWAAGKTGCGEDLTATSRVIIVDREGLRKQTLDHITCLDCRHCAHDLMYSVSSTTRE